MDQFFVVAVAHFLALLIPGVDFFLILRLSVTEGWRRAGAACLGIATANGIIVAAAFSGLSVIENPVVLGVVQLAGGLFLVYLGVAFLRSSPQMAPHGPAEKVPDAPPGRAPWARNFGLGLASGLLNPKNALFYVSLATAVSGAAAMSLVLYGVWMVGLVLMWDVLVAVLFSSPAALNRLGRFVPVLTRGAGAFFVIFGVFMLGELVTGLC